MNFFDKKEEVVEFQLTQYGKFLLSRGELDPKYYAFFDDDILYDREYTGLSSENQNDIQKRIKDNQYLKIISTNAGIESNLSKKINIKRKEMKVGDDERDYINLTTEHEYFMTLPLGTSGDLYDEYPAWDIKVHNGTVADVTASYSSSNQQPIRIPQINLKTGSFVLEANGTPGQVSPEDNCFVLSSRNDFDMDQFSLDFYTFPDGTSIDVRDEFILLEVGEANTADERENFSIEVFIEEQDINGKQVLKPLKFLKQIDEIGEDGLLKTEDEGVDNLYSIEDPQFVENFLEILVDTEISDEILCEFLKEGATYGFLSKRLLKCKEDEDKSRSDIYAANFNDEIELCDD
jgi:hypothetical protein